MHKLRYSLLSLALLFSCASNDQEGRTQTDICRDKMQEARLETESESYFAAQEILNGVLNTCSGTGFMEEAQFLLAQVYYYDESWIDARAEFNLFIEHYPNSPRVEMATYLMAFSGYSSEYSEGRDGSLTDEALEDFQDFIATYPDSPKLDSAKFFFGELKERKASAQMSTAQLYLNMGEPQAAAIYLKDFISTFPISKFYRKAHFKLVESYVRLDQYEQAHFYLDKISHEQEELKDSKEVLSLRKEINEAAKDYAERIQDEKKEELEKRDLQL